MQKAPAPLFERTSAPDNSGLYLRAKTYNNIAQQLNSLTSSYPQQTQYRQSVVNCTNSSGADIGRFKVIEFDRPVVVPGQNPTDDEYWYNNIFLAKQTDSDSVKLGITQESIANDGNEVSEVMVFGITCAYVDVSDSLHEFATTTDVAHQLISTSAATGIRILYTPGTGTDVICKVMIGSGVAQEISYATTNEIIQRGETRAATRWAEHPPVPTGETVQVTYNWLSREQISADKEIAYTTVNGVNAILWAECEDPDPPSLNQLGLPVTDTPQAITATYADIPDLNEIFTAGSGITQSTTPIPPPP